MGAVQATDSFACGMIGTAGPANRRSKKKEGEVEAKRLKKPLVGVRCGNDLEALVKPTNGSIRLRGMVAQVQHSSE